MTYSDTRVDRSLVGMGKTTWLASVALLLALCFVATTSARRCPLLHAPDTANKTGCYIIVVSDDTSPEKVSEILLRVTSVAEDNKLYGLTEKVGIFFTVKLSAYSLELVSVVNNLLSLSLTRVTLTSLTHLLTHHSLTHLLIAHSLTHSHFCQRYIN